MNFVEFSSVRPVPANAKVSALLFFVFLSLFIPLVDSRMAVVKSSHISNDFFSFVDILLSLQLYL
jgi:hypothetical protein